MQAASRVGARVKRLLLGMFVACGAPAPQTVSLAPQHEAAAPDIARTVLACTVVGTGERRRDGESYPFLVYESEDAHLPAFVIDQPARVHVTWMHFPEQGHGRARFSIGGQSHVRFEGVTDTYGRTFTITRRMESVAGHLWVHAGSPADVISANAKGEIFVSVETPFKAPRTIVAQGNCSDLVYQPEFPERAAKERHPSAATPKPFRLYASPTLARPFTTISPSSLVTFDVIERNADFVHVTGDEGHVGFDAWVPSSEIGDFAGPTLVHGRLTGPPVVDALGPRKRVLRDTQLYVGDEPTLVRGAIVEKGAFVVTHEESGAMVAFDFADGLIVAPEGGHLWIAKDVVSSTP